MLNIVIHASGVACFGYALYYDFVHVHLPAHLATKAAFASMQAFPGKWKYLTIWDIVLQLVYHSVSLLNDVAGSNELVPRRQTKLQKFRDSLFASWAFPVGMFVSTTFWGLYAIDRALVFPVDFDSFYPKWLNHAVHTGPAVYMALEVLSVPKLILNRRCLLVGNIGFSVTYLTWITWVYTQNGVWAYPILQILNNVQRGVFFGFSTLLIVGFYYLGEKMNKLRWGGASGEDSKTSSPSGSKGKKAKLT